MKLIQPINYGFKFWLNPEDAYDGPATHEFVLIKKTDDEDEAYKQAARLIGLPEENFVPVFMGDASPYKYNPDLA